MLVQIRGHNATHALEEALITFPSYGVEEASRNGRVLAIPCPSLITIDHPMQRVVIDETRDANPFFHLAEFVWMMAGSNDVRFIEKFNKRMREYADIGTDVHHGAYGHRWRRRFGLDQIHGLIALLRGDPTTRRAVLAMWDPASDNDQRHRDLPCNTHIYLRIISDTLNFVVCNRSNDLIWGCFGANVVHMTFLHELIARAVGVRVGDYQVFSNNLHMYIDRPDVQRLRDRIVLQDCYRGPNPTLPFPVLQPSESYTDFVSDCEDYVAYGERPCRTHWMRHVFQPAMRNFQERKVIARIVADDWRLACELWLARRNPQMELPLVVQ